jgi:glyoxylase-like metal-dependent hydrolase (beta-lactamase superfamily II)
MSSSRREFLQQSGSCAAHLALAAPFMPELARRLWSDARASVVAREPFGNLEKVAEGVWALISTPLTSNDRTTVSNGGIIAGRNAVLAIEGFNQPEGAVWLAGKARELTGRWPTHVVLTHYHADHANGIAGYFANDGHPAVHATDRTKTLVLERNQPANADRTAALRDSLVLGAAGATTLDLGGRSVRVVPRLGHTESDLSLELDEPSITFCGDLVWNAMFPNFVDAIPTKLAVSARALRRPRETIYVPGHGPIAHAAEFDRYIAMLDEVERAARKAHADGVPPATAGGNFSLPTSLGEWALFNKVFYQRAFEAWERELRAAAGAPPSLGT